MFLFLDIGNSTTHAALGTARSLRAFHDLSTASWKSAEAGATLDRFISAASPAVRTVVFSSVVPAVTSHVEKWAASRGLEASRLTPEAQHVVKIKYLTPATLGTDRLANAMAAYRKYGGPVIVIGCGTAVVVDAVDARGNYRGGIIGPGIAMFRDYLHEKTAQLPAVKLRPTRRYIGRSTEESILSGCVKGFEGAVQAWVSGIKQELKVRRVTIVAAGPYASMLRGTIPGLILARRSLTLEGLRIFAAEM